MKITIELDLEDPKQKALAAVLIAGPAAVDSAVAASGDAGDAVAPAKTKRERRTKAQIEADKAAEAAAVDPAGNPATADPATDVGPIPTVEQLSELFNRVRAKDAAKAAATMKAHIPEGKSARDLEPHEMFNLAQALESVAAESFF